MARELWSPADAEMRRLEKRRRRRLGEAYKRNGHERLVYHARAVVPVVEQPEEGAAAPRRSSVSQLHRAESMPGWEAKKPSDEEKEEPVVAEEAIASSVPRGSKRSSGVSSEEERKGGMSLYTQHLREVLSHNAQSTYSALVGRGSLDDKPEEEEEQQPGGGDSVVVDNEAAAAAVVERKRASARIDFGEDWVLERTCAPMAFRHESAWSCGSLMSLGRRRRRRDRMEISEGCAPACVRLLRLAEPQLRHLHRCFCRIDVDASGSVTVSELLAYFETEPSAFVRVFMDNVVFDWADLDTDGALDFGEFVLAVSTVCCLSRHELLGVLFQVFDSDESGQIERDEFQRLSSAIVDMGSLFPGNYAHFFKEFDTNDDGAIDIDEFVKINDRFPMLFFPAEKLQDAFKRRTFSVDFWEAKADAYAERNAGERFHTKIAAIGNAITWRPVTPPPPPPLLLQGPHANSSFSEDHHHSNNMRRRSSAASLQAGGNHQHHLQRRPSRAHSRQFSTSSVGSAAAAEPSSTASAGTSAPPPGLHRAPSKSAVRAGTMRRLPSRLDGAEAGQLADTPTTGSAATSASAARGDSKHLLLRRAPTASKVAGGL